MRAARLNLISGLLPQFEPGGIISLQYADDTLLFLDNSLDKAANLKWLLVCFEQLSGMKINYDKSDLLTIGMDDDRANEFARIFCCKRSNFPIKYLGVPLHFSKLRREDLQPIIVKIVKRIAGWKGRLLSYAGRLVLLKSCLASIPIYLLSVIKFPRWAIDMINTHMGHFLWNNTEDKHKYHLANWQLVSQKKELGGLGIPDLRSLNMALLSSWIFRYHLNSNSIWTRIIDFKYRTKKPNIFCCPDVGVSPFWKGVIWAMQAAHMGVRWVVGNGEKVRFWEDQWLGNTSLAILFWPLYVINEQHGKSIKDIWNGEELQLSFRRNVSERLMLMWDELRSVGDSIALKDEEDQILWSYSSSGKYSVQSLYAIINHRGVVPVFIQAVWKLNIPPRVQFFLWLLSNNRLLTRDNLAKRKEVSDPTCLFCEEKDSISHLFFQCCVAVNVWEFISVCCSRSIGADFESVASLWLAGKKFMVCNIVSSAVLWVLWKLRNSICFLGVPWLGMKKVFVMVGRMLRSWLRMFKLDVQEKVEQFIQLVEVQASLAPRIKWSTDTSGLALSTARRLEGSGDAMMFPCNRA
jgi:hypothetical protein